MRQTGYGRPIGAVLFSVLVHLLGAALLFAPMANPAPPVFTSVVMVEMIAPPQPLPPMEPLPPQAALPEPPPPPPPPPVEMPPPQTLAPQPSLARPKTPPLRTPPPRPIPPPLRERTQPPEEAPVVTAPVVAPMAPVVAQATPAPLPSVPEQAATYLHTVVPDYPPLARRLGQAGRVLLRVELDERGEVKRLALQESSGYPLLDQAALESVAKYRFVPAQRGGVAVAGSVEVPVSFRLEDLS